MHIIFDSVLYSKFYGNQRKERNVEKYIQWVTTLSLTILIYLYSRSTCYLANQRNHAKFCETVQGYTTGLPVAVEIFPVELGARFTALILSAHSTPFVSMRVCVCVCACVCQVLQEENGQLDVRFFGEHDR